MDWTQAKMDMLRDLWEQTDPVMSASEIARQIGTTKNGVVGKAFRMKLAARPSPIQPRSVKQTPERSPRHTLPDVDRPRGPKPEPVAVAVKPKPPKVPVAAKVPLLVQVGPIVPEKKAGCRYPLWTNAEKPTGRFCSSPVARRADGVPMVYCAAHAAICYGKVERVG